MSSFHLLSPIDHFIDNQLYQGSQGVNRHLSPRSGEGGTSSSDPSKETHLIFLF